MRAIIVTEKQLDDYAALCLAQILSRTSPTSSNPSRGEDGKVDGRVEYRTVHYEVYQLVARLKDGSL